jgi:hypothetical protein
MVMRISGSAQFIHTPSPWGTTPVPSDDIHARRGVASLLDANRAEQTIAVAELNSLETGGISWKIYATPDGNAGDNVLPYFKQYQSDANLAAKAFGPSFPAEFQADCATGKLPQVSWVLASLVDSEHPPAPVTWGEVAVAQMLNAITSNPSLWAKTAVFITYRGPLQSACALQAEGRRDDGPKPPDRGERGYNACRRKHPHHHKKHHRKCADEDQAEDIKLRGHSDCDGRHPGGD